MITPKQNKTLQLSSWDELDSDISMFKTKQNQKSGFKLVIGVDANEANTKERVGINQYAYELLWAIYKTEEKLRFKNSYVLYLKQKPASDLPLPREGWEYKVLPGRALWIVSKLTPHLMFYPEVDVFFTPGHYLPPLFFTPTVCTIHDLGFLNYSEQFTSYDYWQLKMWTAISLFISKDIIAVSNATRQDIVRHYKFASKKITTIHHGVDSTRFNPKIPATDVRRIKSKYKIKGEYILYLGTLKPSKNILGILRSFRIIKDLGYRVSLVIAGKKGWLYEEIYKKAQDLELNDSIIFTDFIDEKDKPAMISGARLLLSPSYWEGFGMHILEALACGTPVVASKVASIPEICGDSCYLVDPGEINVIVEGIKHYLNMSLKEYNEEKIKAHEQSKKFLWETAANETINLITKGK